MQIISAVFCLHLAFYRNKIVCLYAALFLLYFSWALFGMSVCFYKVLCNIMWNFMKQK